MTPPSTRERILDAAEELFAERGIGGTSLRALTRHADVNLAAVHYHFGSKDGLLDAVVERLATPINRDRHSALDRLEASAAGGPSASRVLDAFFGPVVDRLEQFERAGRTATLARLLARIESLPRDEVERLAERHFGEIARRTVNALCRALPGMDRAVVAHRFRLASAVLTALYADSGVPRLDESPGGAAVPGPDTAARAREALAFAQAGLCADPWPAHTDALRRRAPEPEAGRTALEAVER